MHSSKRSTSAFWGFEQPLRILNFSHLEMCFSIKYIATVAYPTACREQDLNGRSHAT